MNVKALFSLLLVVTFFQTGIAQSPIGVWKTVDDNTGEAKSHVEIYEQNGKLYGKIVDLLLKPDDTVCTGCKGAKQGKPLVGMNIIWELKPYEDYYSYGTIMDPENGKEYKCNVWFEDGDTNELHVRGYIGMPALGRTQIWQKVK